MNAFDWVSGFFDFVVVKRKRRWSAKAFSTDEACHSLCQYSLPRRMHIVLCSTHLLLDQWIQPLARLLKLGNLSRDQLIHLFYTRRQRAWLDSAGRACFSRTIFGCRCEFRHTVGRRDAASSGDGAMLLISLRLRARCGLRNVFETGCRGFESTDEGG